MSKKVSSSGKKKTVKKAAKKATKSAPRKKAGASKASPARKKTKKTAPKKSVRKSAITRPRPFEVSPIEYPFKDHWMEREGSAMHYVDEGRGKTVLLLHGNPTWSFLYRNIIKNLDGEFRCIAPDYPGFGFSDHPPGYNYTPEEHSEWVKELVTELKLKNIILVVQDWGGPIGLSLAVERPDLIDGLVIANTWGGWNPGMTGIIFSSIMGGPLGKHLHLKKNFFANKLVPSGIFQKTRKTPEILKAYTDPFPTVESRMGTYVFPREIRKSAPWTREIADRLHVLRDKPIEMVWGMKDDAFGNEKTIKTWQSYLPQAKVERLNDAAHYIQEDRPDRIAEAVRRVMTRV